MTLTETANRVSQYIRQGARPETVAALIDNSGFTVDQVQARLDRRRRRREKYGKPRLKELRPGGIRRVLNHSGGVEPVDVDALREELAAVTAERDALTIKAAKLRDRIRRLTR